MALYKDFGQLKTPVWNAAAPECAAMEKLKTKFSTAKIEDGKRMQVRKTAFYISTIVNILTILSNRQGTGF